MNQIDLPPHGYVKLLRVAGPWHDNDITDVAHAARVSFNATEDYSRERALGLVDYLWEHRHTTPFEMIETWWEMKLPIFVARQLVRHRTVSINEVSRRYVTDPIEFYLPEVWRKKAESKKQGSSDEEADIDLWRLHTVLSDVRKMYENLLYTGVAPEMARMILPQCAYTRWIWHQDLHNLLHMLSLRIDPHAQKETRDVAHAVLALLAGEMPAVRKFIRNGE